MPVTVVAAVARNGVIGRDGDLPWHLPEDLRRFKQLTMGHVLVMGRKTFESIGRPLPGRTTIVVTRQAGWPAPQDVLVAGDLEAALQQAAALDDDVFVVGGAEVYRQALGEADVLELTEVDAEPEGDVHFPQVDWSQWRETSRIVGEGFDFVTYQRREES
jgi:dihydrofolate reductase